MSHDDDPQQIIYRLFGEEWKKLVRSIKFRCTGIGWADAEDIAIEAGIKFLGFDFTRIHGLGPEDQRKLIYAYLKYCVIGSIGDYRRHQEALSKLMSVMESDGKRIRKSPDEVKAAFERLPEEPRFLLGLLFYQGKDLDEAQRLLAERTGRALDMRSVKARVQRALDKLKLELTHQ